MHNAGTIDSRALGVHVSPILLTEHRYRFWQGLGTGEALNEFAATGQWPSYEERRERLNDHIKYAQQYIDMGFDCLIFHTAGPDQRAFLEGYARDVFPHLRERNKRS